MSSFRFDSGEKRQLIRLVNGQRTFFAHATTKASDATMAVKYLRTRMQGEIMSSSKLFSEFLTGKLCLVVISGEPVDQRLVDHFA